MNTLKTTYKTSTKSGIVTITKRENKYFGSFDGLAEIEVTFGIKQGLSVIAINMAELNRTGYNCPAKDIIVAIILPEIKDHKSMLASFFPKTEKGKWCDDGMWRTYKEIREMNYTEQVLTGTYHE